MDRRTFTNDLFRTRYSCLYVKSGERPVTQNLSLKTLASTGGNNQSGSAGSALPQALTVALSPRQSGGTASGSKSLRSPTPRELPRLF